MSDELVEAVARAMVFADLVDKGMREELAKYEASHELLDWMVAARAAIAVVIERCAKAIDDTEIYGAGPGWTERELYKMSIRKLGESE